MSGHPKIENAPGLKWFPRKDGWEARWRARLDLVRAGFETKSVPLWRGAVPDEGAVTYIQNQCDRLQTKMLNWSRGGIPELAPAFDGTLKSLIDCYRSDPDSRYGKLRFATRRNYDAQCRRLIREHGAARVEDMDARLMLRWHDAWTEGGKIATGHSLIAMLRTLMTFGKTFLKSKDCAGVKDTLSDMKFQMPKRREEWITAEQAITVRAKAHELGLPSIALAQAFQFECLLRQKDVIGEWVPNSEPGLSTIAAGNDKWMVGLRWSEIDENLILKHTTSKKQKAVEIDLKLAPMVMEELARIGTLPTSGPVIVFETTGAPYYAYQFRREWRFVARAAGVPTKTFNMDSRSGGITEATDAGSPLEHVRHAATHSNIQTTQGYSRGQIEKTAGVMRTRVEHRNKK